MIFNILTFLLIAILTVILTSFIFIKSDLEDKTNLNFALFTWVTQIVIVMWAMSYMNWWR